MLYVCVVFFLLHLAFHIVQYKYKDERVQLAVKYACV